MSTNNVNLSAFIGTLGGIQSPEIQAAVATARQLEADIKAALPAIAVMVANGLLAKVPGGSLIAPFLDPAIKEGATIAENAMWGLLDHALQNPAITAQAEPAAPLES